MQDKYISNNAHIQDIVSTGIQCAAIKRALCKKFNIFKTARQVFSIGSKKILQTEQDLCNTMNSYVNNANFCFRYYQANLVSYEQIFEL